MSRVEQLQSAARKVQRGVRATTAEGDRQLTAVNIKTKTGAFTLGGGGVYINQRGQRKKARQFDRLSKAYPLGPRIPLRTGLQARPTGANRKAYDRRAAMEAQGKVVPAKKPAKRGDGAHEPRAAVRRQGVGEGSQFDRGLGSMDISMLRSTPSTRSLALLGLGGAGAVGGGVTLTRGRKVEKNMARTGQIAGAVGALAGGQALYQTKQRDRRKLQAYEGRYGKTPPVAKAFAAKDENSSIPTTYTWTGPKGPNRARTMVARSGAFAGKSRGVGRKECCDENSSPKVTRLTPRTPSGKFVSHENDLKVFHPVGGPKTRQERSSKLVRVTKADQGADGQFVTPLEPGFGRELGRAQGRRGVRLASLA